MSQVTVRDRLFHGTVRGGRSVNGEAWVAEWLAEARQRGGRKVLGGRGHRVDVEEPHSEAPARRCHSPVCSCRLEEDIRG